MPAKRLAACRFAVGETAFVEEYENGEDTAGIRAPVPIFGKATDIVVKSGDLAQQTEIVAEASVDLTGRIMQVGRGMIQGVSKQLFQQFVVRARQQLEAEAAAK